LPRHSRPPDLVWAESAFERSLVDRNIWLWRTLSDQTVKALVQEQANRAQCGLSESGFQNRFNINQLMWSDHDSFSEIGGLSILTVMKERIACSEARAARDADEGARLDNRRWFQEGKLVNGMSDGIQTYALNLWIDL
jgi:hypothetical protein